MRRNSITNEATDRVKNHCQGIQKTLSVAFYPVSGLANPKIATF
jgi:hypothetical protein